MELLSSSYKKSTRLINSVICSSRPCPHPVKASPSPKAAPMEGNILVKPRLFSHKPRPYTHMPRLHVVVGKTPLQESLVKAGERRIGRRTNRYGRGKI